jgi:tRNA(Arg) A34 adenosine deaminase TadA
MMLNGLKTLLHSVATQLKRRGFVLLPVVSACLPIAVKAPDTEVGLRWIRAAEEMRRQALSWGDQAYGAVLVKDNRIIGYGPSRVVKNNDPGAHAEREAIKHAIAEVGKEAVKGSALYSTSRPCRLCEAAAAQAGVVRMYFGAEVQDAGKPRADN